MHSLKPTQNPNFFQHTFSNHIQEETSNAFKWTAARLAKASPWVLSLGLRDFGTVTEQGIVEEVPQFPFRLVFQPMVNTSQAIPTIWNATLFTDDLVNNLTLTNQLLFNVFAYADPVGMNITSPVLIGKIYSRGPAVKSIFADE